MALNGSNVLLYVYDKDYDTVENTTYPDKFIPVADQTSLSDEQSKNIIDTAAKGDAHVKGIYGRQEGSISIEALYFANPTSADEKGYLVLKNSFNNNKVVYVKITDGTNTEYAEALIESIGREFPDDDVSTVSVELRLNTALSSVAPTISDDVTSGSATA
jgi:Phage tail tube protein